MQRWFFYILLLIPVSSIGQGLTFDEYIYDFGVIREDGGEVSRRFTFQNQSFSPISIVAVQSSCGCTVAELSGTWFDPSDNGSIMIKYDPKDRIGWFSKSVKILYRHQSDTALAYLTVKGIAVEDEDNLLTPVDEEVHYDIRIKPFTANGISEYDTSFLSTTRFNTFINDITYIIDEQNFVELKLSVDVSSPQEDVASDMASIVKRNIIAALKRRNYEPFQVGFTPIEGKTSTENDNPVNVRITAPGFTDQSLEESVIKVTNTGKGITETEVVRKGLDTLFIEPFVLDYHRVHGYLAEIDPESEAFDRFISRIVRSTLADGYSDIGIRAVVFEKDGMSRRDERKYTKHIENTQDEIRDRLMDAGLAESSFNIIPPKLEVHPFPKGPIDHDTVNFIQVTRYYVPQVVVEDTLNLEEPSYKEISDNIPYQNLPVYTELMNDADEKIDTTSSEFLKAIGPVLDFIRSGKQVSFVIESSASRAPSMLSGAPTFRSIERGNDAAFVLSVWLMNQDVAESSFDIKPIVDVVKGPDYDRSTFRASDYRQFDYIRIIPTFETNYKPTRADALIPYRINFETDIKELPTETILFQNFITKMAEVITKQGYVRLIIESSSSRIPSTLYRTNRQLAFYRVESAEENIRRELGKRGVDPRKLIVVEQRMLVQGPPYDPKKNRSIYTDYQYVKIIPEAIIRQ